MSEGEDINFDASTSKQIVPAERSGRTKRKEKDIITARHSLYVSAVFAVARCPSVRLSVTFVHSTQTAEDIVKLLRRPGSRIILFSTLAPIPNSNGNPFSGGAKYKGWEYFVILD